jgi:hypothetical protein
MTDTKMCGCIKCTGARAEELRRTGADIWETLPGPGLPGWRYACEMCGNKRCPHHTDHSLACTNSNDTGQPGSVFA